MPESNAASFIRFGTFELDVRARELRRRGLKIKLQEQPLQVLLVLLEKPGQIVSREELRQRIWQADTFVEFDQGVYSALRRLRESLDDSAENPRYIETVPRRGYRFIAPIKTATDSVSLNAPQPADETGQGSISIPKVALVSIIRLRWLSAALAGGVIVVGAVLLIAWWHTSPPSPVVDSVVQLTDDGQIKGAGLSSDIRSARLATDGLRIYFNEGPPLSQKIGQVSVTGGPTARVETRLENPTIEGATRDGSELIILAGSGATPPFPLWAMPLPAGEPRPLGSTEADAAGSLPDGRIISAIGKDLFIAGHDGSSPRELVSLPGRVASLEPSPDGKRVLLQLDMKGDNANELETFELAVDGTGVKTIRSSSSNECCFHWSWDGNYLLYSVKAANRWDIWALPIHAGVFRKLTKPIRLTTGPLSFSGGAIPSRDGKQIFAVASKQHGELLRYDLKLHQFVPLLSGISATDATFSDDGKWVAYLSYPDHSVWRSRSNGTERMQLTFPPVEASNPFISPDGSRVAYTTDSGTFLIDINGGTAKKIYETSQNPMWSPDGKSILITILSGGINYSMQMIDAGTGRASLVRASEGKGAGIWLDQKTLLAANATQTKLLTLYLDSGKSTNFFTGSPVDWINSPDRKHVYITTGGAEPIIQRIRVRDRMVETIVSLKDFAQLSNYSWTRLRVSPDGSPTLTRALDTQEIYALQVR